LALAELKQVKDILGGLLPAPPLANENEAEKEKTVPSKEVVEDPLGAHHSP